jgi:hypothetical protein
MCSHGILVNHVPKAFDQNSSHSIIIPGKLELPLKTQGVLSYLQTRKPTKEELAPCERIELTSADTWEPHKILLEPTN